MYKKTEFGMVKGRMAMLYTIGNDDIRAAVSDYGATLVSLRVRDRSGHLRDVVLGFETASEYAADGSFFGAVVGRNANRISKASFTLDGVLHKLSANEGENNLHSGPDYFNKRFFTLLSADDGHAKFGIISPAGDQGFPGEELIVTYRVTENRLEIEYSGISEPATVFNVTNHSFFNLNGQGSGSVEDHSLIIEADRYTVTDGQLIPTGELRPVSGSPYDFTSSREIGESLKALAPGTIDINYALNDTDGAPSAFAYGPRTGIVMKVYTDLPGLQLYVPPHFHGKRGKGLVSYDEYAAFCLETQYFPDAVNRPEFVSPVIPSGEKKFTTTVFAFDVM